MISAVLLAAGAARRFGAPKLLAELDGKPIVRWSAEALVGEPVDEIIVVVPPAADELQAALRGIDVRFVVNPHPERGIASSIACGVSAVGAGTDAVLMALGDEPMAGRSALERVVAEYRKRGVKIVSPMFDGVRGHPVLFDKSVIAELRTLSGDAGARSVIERDAGRVSLVEMGQPMPMDVDTPDDLARLRDRAQYMAPPTPRHS